MATKPLTNFLTMEGEEAVTFYEKVAQPLSAAQKRSIRTSTGTYELQRAKWKKDSLKK